MIIITFFSCNSNSKLKQETAEIVIRKYMDVNKFTAQPWGTRIFNEVSSTTIESIGPITQPFDNEASTIVTFSFYDTEYRTDKATLKFIFKKNIDNNKWFLTSILAVKGTGSSAMKEFLVNNYEINILAQE